MLREKHKRAKLTKLQPSQAGQILNFAFSTLFLPSSHDSRQIFPRSVEGNEFWVELPHYPENRPMWTSATIFDKKGGRWDLRPRLQKSEPIFWKKSQVSGTKKNNFFQSCCKCSETKSKLKKSKVNFYYCWWPAPGGYLNIFTQIWDLSFFHQNLGLVFFSQKGEVRPAPGGYLNIFARIWDLSFFPKRERWDLRPVRT